MTEVINLREIILGILMEVMEEEEYSHIVLRNVLEKYQFLDKRDRAFISRVSEGTLENLIQLDYIIDQFAAVKTADMKPAIRNILRMSVYQLKYMDNVPDSAVCNESVKLAQRKGFYNLKALSTRSYAALPEIWIKSSIQTRKPCPFPIFPLPIPCRSGF